MGPARDGHRGADIGLRGMVRQAANQQARADKTRRQLLEATRLVISELGFEGAAVDVITERAAVSKGAFYFHFDSKDEAFAALAANWAIDVDAETGAILLEHSKGQVELSSAVKRLLAAGNAGWQPRLLLEFVRRAEQDGEVATALATGQASWRRAANALVARERKGGPGATGISNDSATATLVSIREGLVFQSCLPEANRAALLRSATSAALIVIRTNSGLGQPSRRRVPLPGRSIRQPRKLPAGPRARYARPPQE